MKKRKIGRDRNGVSITMYNDQLRTMYPPPKGVFISGRALKQPVNGQWDCLIHEVPMVWTVTAGGAHGPRIKSNGEIRREGASGTPETVPRLNSYREAMRIAHLHAKIPFEEETIPLVIPYKTPRLDICTVVQEPNVKPVGFTWPKNKAELEKRREAAHQQIAELARQIAEATGYAKCLEELLSVHG